MHGTERKYGAASEQALEQYRIGGRTKGARTACERLESIRIPALSQLQRNEMEDVCIQVSESGVKVREANR